jgi:ABC-type enterobactin transport system permease subunit
MLLLLLLSHSRACMLVIANNSQRYSNLVCPISFVSGVHPKQVQRLSQSSACSLATLAGALTPQE